MIRFVYGRFSLSNEDSFSVIERVLIVSWLMTDLGWMTTNILIGYPFGIIAIFSHIYLLLIDTRRSFRFYDFSLVLWILGNFLWMSTELFSGNPSSDIHLGPKVPIGGISNTSIEQMTTAKTILFLIAWLTQIAMYIGILCGFVAMPEDIDEDIQARNEINYLLCGFKRTKSDNNVVVSEDHDIALSSSSLSSSSSHHSSDSDHQEFIINPITATTTTNTTTTAAAAHDNNDNDRNNNNDDLKVIDTLSMISSGDGGGGNNDDDDDSSDNIRCMSRHTPSDKYHISLAFIERVYIIFWISKDFFWSVGTGEVFNYKPLAPIWEGLAMVMGCSAIFVYVAGCYVYRRDFMQLLDNVSTIMWICANFVWMCGEFFLRYNNLQFDDTNEGNDRSTRIASCALFLVGTFLQIYLICASIAMYIWPHRRTSQESTERRTDLYNVVKQSIRYQALMISISPQRDHDSKSNSSYRHEEEEEEEEESTILF